MGVSFLLQTKIDRLQGADLASLEAKIQQHIGTGDADTGEDFGQGLVRNVEVFFINLLEFSNL